MTTRMPCWACEGLGWFTSDDEPDVSEPCEHCKGSGWTIIGASMESKNEGEKE